MCGRYALYGPRKRSRVDNQYLHGLDAFPDRYNIAPTQMLPIVRLVDGATCVTTAKWRLIRRADGGLSIGLSIVRGMVEMHGGFVTANSRGRVKAANSSLRLHL